MPTRPVQRREAADTKARLDDGSRRVEQPTFASDSGAGTPLPPPPRPRVVSEDQELASLATRWRSCPAIAFDTEFVRTRTYYPKLGLIQVGDPEAIYLVDTLAIRNFEPLVELLTDPDTVKVLHSPSEDLEVFQHDFDLIPQPIYDTQTVATVAGLGSSLSYQSLVLELFGVELPKHQQRSNWMRRPLTADQIEYASLDVAYLLPAYELLEQTVDRLGRRDWVREEHASLLAEARERLDPMRIVRRLQRSSLSPLQARVLEDLVLWREQEASDRDLPRNFVLRDEVLLELARRLPEKRGDLEEVRSLGARERARYGSLLLDLARRTRAQPAPARSDDGTDPRSRKGARPHKRQVNQLRDVVAEVATEVGVPPDFLAKRRWLEELAWNAGEGRRELPEGLRGWRQAVIGERLLAELESNGSLRAD